MFLLCYICQKERFQNWCIIFCVCSNRRRRALLNCVVVLLYIYCAPPQSQPPCQLLHKMSGGGMLYGGDEIGALVFDPGHHSMRVGYAQEDTPKAEIPAVVGVAPGETAAAMDLESKPTNNATSSKCIFTYDNYRVFFFFI